jgi:cytochrome bd ubiquinol oxidase subunit II
MDLDLPFIWALLIAIAVLAYVVLDGFDLGIGILFPFFRGKDDRDLMMNSIAPVWDGNETWLILGGGGLMAAFPLAYAIVLPALYMPLTLMLLALVFRGVAFEFRFKASPERRWVWDFAFIGGSLIATLCQGIALGAFVQGIEVEGRGYGGGWFDWLTPFSVLTGVSLIAGYALLGVTWLIMKSSGPLQQRAFRLAMPIGVLVVAAVGAVSIATPLLDPDIARRWFSWPNILYLSPVPAVVAVLAFTLWRSLVKRREVFPFLLVLGLFGLSYLGLGISLYPFVVPRTVTIWQAASPDSTLSFLLVGAVILLPIIIGYTAYAYWVFRGKVGKSGYHA